MRPILSRFFLSSSVLFLTTCLLVPLSFADIYRYTDEQGAVVLNRQGVPPQYVNKGYQILNEQGRVIKVVPRAPTPEEVKQVQVEQKRRENDARLLRLYSSAEDVGRVKQSKLREFDILIDKAKKQLSPINSKLTYLYDKQLESRRDPQVPDNTGLALEISQLKTEQKRLQDVLAQYKEQRRQMEADFTLEQARLRELLGEHPVSDTVATKPR